MKDQTFGIEIETAVLGREQTAKAIARLFGTTAKYENTHLNNWVVPMPDGRRWIVEHDGSVYPNPAEVVSPVCHWNDIDMVQNVVRAIRKAGAQANGSCGIHVHIGLGNHTAKTLRNLVNLVNSHEDMLTDSLQISPERRGEWCRPVEPELLNALNKRGHGGNKAPKTLEEFAELWYKCDPRSAYTGERGQRGWRSCAATHYEPSRYHLLNLHATFSTERPARTIEFRAFNGTLHAGEIKAYIQLCLAISHRALESASCSPARPVTDNPAYAFRCWLLKLGLIGDEFKTARLHLLKHMPGNAAWRHGEPTTRHRG